MAYHALKRIPGKKWITVATLNTLPVSCIARAITVFAELGINADSVNWETVTKQKNWQGYSPDCQRFTLSQEEQDKLEDIAHARFYHRMNSDITFWQGRLSYELDDLAALEKYWGIL